VLGVFGGVFILNMLFLNNKKEGSPA